MSFKERLVDTFLLTHKAISHCKLQTPIQVLNEILPAVEKECQLDIKVLRVDWLSQKAINGMLYRCKDHATVICYSGLNLCWSRFVICKELSHILIDQPLDYTSDILELVNSILVGSPIGLTDAVDSETLAFFGAVQLLIPEQLSDEFDRLDVEGGSNFEIANHFKIPEVVVSIRRASRYKELAEDFVKVIKE